MKSGKRRQKRQKEATKVGERGGGENKCGLLSTETERGRGAD